jgi:hypothetical protein
LPAPLLSPLPPAPGVRSPSGLPLAPLSEPAGDAAPPAWGAPPAVLAVAPALPPVEAGLELPGEPGLPWEPEAPALELELEELEPEELEELELDELELELEELEELGLLEGLLGDGGVGMETVGVVGVLALGQPASARQAITVAAAPRRAARLLPVAGVISPLDPGGRHRLTVGKARPELRPAQLAQ